MEEKLRILLLEDSSEDAELIRHELKKNNLDFIINLTSNKKAFSNELAEFRPDLVLVDYNLPDLDGIAALKMVKKENPDTPVILVSGTIGEEAAVESLKEGASDYVLKDRLYRLFPVVCRTMAEAAEHAARKKCEEEKEIAQKNWQMSFDAIGDSMMILDGDCRVVAANRATQAFINTPLDAAAGKRCYELVHQTTAPPDFCPVQKMKKSGKHEEEEVRLPGTDTWVLISVYPIINGNNELTGAIHVVRDITGRKKAEEALKISETKYKTMFESSNDAIMILKADEMFLDGNFAAIKMFGCGSKEEFISKSPADLSPEYQPDGKRSPEKAHDMMFLAMKYGKNIFEWKHKRVSGEEFFAMVLLTKMELDKETVLQATVRDIDEMKRMEEEREKTLRELQIFYKASIGREEKVLELKGRIAELEEMLKRKK